VLSVFSEDARHKGMKILMRAMFSSLLAFFGFGCAGQNGSQHPKTQKVNAADLKPNVIIKSHHQTA